MSGSRAVRRERGEGGGDIMESRRRATTYVEFELPIPVPPQERLGTMREKTSGICVCMCGVGE